MNREDQLLNRSEIIRMAREAGLILLLDEDCFQAMGVKNFERTKRVIERFAALIASRVAAAERKAMMQLFTDPENQPTQHGTVTVEYMQREIAAEREACAKVCEVPDEYEDWEILGGPDGRAIMNELAAAIRARGET